MPTVVRSEWEINPLLLNRLTEFAEQLLAAVGESEAELSIALVDDETIRNLNRDYRGIDAATDVLSFSQREGEKIGWMEVLGDIVISVETATRQAQEYGHTLESELLELTFHGCLHLLGWDHEPDRKLWEEKETEIRRTLKQSGFWFIPQGLSI